MVAQMASQNAPLPVTQLDAFRRSEIERSIRQAVERDMTGVPGNQVELYFREHAALLAERDAVVHHNERLSLIVEDQKVIIDELQTRVYSKPVTAQEIIDLHQHLG